MIDACSDSKSFIQTDFKSRCNKMLFYFLAFKVLLLDVSL